MRAYPIIRINCTLISCILRELILKRDGHDQRGVSRKAHEPSHSFLSTSTPALVCPSLNIHNKRLPLLPFMIHYSMAHGLAYLDSTSLATCLGPMSASDLTLQGSK